MNEVWNVLTYRDYDFKDESGRQVKGRSLHCYRSQKENGWPGVEYAKFSIRFGSDAYNTVPALGKPYELIFDRFGKVSALIPIEDAR